MSARRALKSLETLARARDMELTDLRRAAAAAADRVAAADHLIGRIQEAVVTEAEASGDDLDMLQAYGVFAAQCRGRLKELYAQREAFANEAEAAEIAVLDGYRALKQIEEAATARRTEIADEEARKERAVADDLAAIRAVRQAQSGF